MNPMLSVRVPQELMGWLNGYAAKRGASRSAVVCWALREAMLTASRGVPDLEPPAGGADGRSASLGRVRGAGARSPSSAGRAPVASRSAAGAPALPELVSELEPSAAPEFSPPMQRVASATLERVVAMRQKGPVALARRDVRAGRVLVDGVVCRDPERLVLPGSVEVT